MVSTGSLVLTTDELDTAIAPNLQLKPSLGEQPQSHKDGVSYVQAVREVIKADGIMGLLGRGLQTKIIANGLQGLMFSVLWKAIEEKLNK